MDVWALGCIFYNLTTLEHPFKDATIETLPLYVIDKDPKPIKGQYGGYLINFINNLMTKNAKNRPDIFHVNIELRERDNPQPPNKVQVYNFKKLLMIRSDMDKLDLLQTVNLPLFSQ